LGDNPAIWDKATKFDSHPTAHVTSYILLE